MTEYHWENGNRKIASYSFAEEISKAVTFLASDESSYVLGEEISVDGGWTQL